MRKIELEEVPELEVEDGDPLEQSRIIDSLLDYGRKIKHKNYLHEKLEYDPDSEGYN